MPNFFIEPRQWLKTPLGLLNSQDKRSPESLVQVVLQFDLNHARYRPQKKEGRDQQTGDVVLFYTTFCNIFVWDVTRALGCEVPHWVDKNGNPAEPGGSAHEQTANGLSSWFEHVSPRFGWSRVSAQMAQTLSSSGKPVVPVWRNPSGPGHIAICLPGDWAPGGPWVAQAGKVNFARGKYSQGFGNREAAFWAHA